MKILLIDVVSRQGSTGKIAADIDRCLHAEHIESKIFYGRKHAAGHDLKFCRGWEAAVNKLTNMAGALRYGDRTHATSRLIRHIRAEAPDVVHIHCINGFCVSIYQLFKFLADAKIATVVTHHAEFFYTGCCIYALDCTKFASEQGCRNCPMPRFATGSLWTDNSHKSWQRMRMAIEAFDKDKLVFAAVSPWEQARAARSPLVAGYDCRLVTNGLDTDVFRAAENRNAIRPRIPGCRQKIALHVTSHFSNRSGTFKGGDAVVELARQMPEVTFVVVAARTRVTGKLPANMHLWGSCTDQKELASLYNAADVTVITSMRETFSMIVAESLCCGTPVAGFCAGGPESIAIQPYSCFISRNKGIAGLKTAVTGFLDHKYDHTAISREAAGKYSARDMTAKYIGIYKSFRR